MQAALMSDETEDQRWERLSQDRVDRPLPKRFYKAVSFGNDFAILLDGRNVKTPLKAKLQLPNAAVAEAVAAEWQAQELLINPATMPLTKLANTAIDRAATERAFICDEIKAYAANDLLYYRAEAPAGLVGLQDQHWNPVLTWASTYLSAPFQTTRGIIHITQPAETVTAIDRHVETLDGFHLIIAHNLVTLSGSALLAFKLMAKAASADEVWAAAHVDEDFQISQWGGDHEAKARRDNRKREFGATVMFLSLI
jgi:chaperone required for assembly of F1-ATPase